MLPSFCLAAIFAVGGAETLARIRPAPSFELIDSHRESVSGASFKGKIVVVSFIYTTCTGTCPLTTLKLNEVRKALQTEKLWGSKVEFVSISLDPERDTPETLAKHARAKGIDTQHWRFLTGDPERVRKVIKAWDMWAKTDQNGVIDHPSRIFLIDAEGIEREIYSLETLSVETVLADIRALGEPAGAQQNGRNDRRISAADE